MNTNNNTLKPYEIIKYDFPIFKLDKNNICKFDEFVYEQTNICLEISENIDIDEIYKKLLHRILKNIKTIVICGINNINDILCCLDNVEFIKFESKKQYILDLDLFKKLKYLKYLSINNYNIINSQNIKSIENLIYLELNNSCIDDNNILLYVNKNLKFLKLYNNTYIRLCYIEEFNNLRYISVWDKHLYVKNKYIKHMYNIQVLEIYNLDNIYEINKLNDLKFVRLSLIDQLIDIKDLKNLHNIECLDIVCNDNTCIESFEYLTKLKKLSIYNYNNINNLLLSVNSSQLEILNIYINYNDDINFKLLKNMINIRSLKIIGKNDDSIKLNIDIDYITKMKNLELLYIKNIDIKNIEYMDNFINLKILKLINGNITNINFINNNINIIELNLSSNFINDIKYLKYLYNLKKLSLEMNNITDIVPLLYLNNLNYINLKFNTLNNANTFKYIKSNFKFIDIYIDNIYINDKLYENKQLNIF